MTRQQTYIVTVKDIRIGTIEVKATSEEAAKAKVNRQAEIGILESNVHIYDGDFEIVGVVSEETP